MSEVVFCSCQSRPQHSIRVRVLFGTGAKQIYEQLVTRTRCPNGLMRLGDIAMVEAQILCFISLAGFYFLSVRDFPKFSDRSQGKTIFSTAVKYKFIHKSFLVAIVSH
jgi:hypothetical protein